MNDVSGYYSCSVNPSYISTWFISFHGRKIRDTSVRLFPEESPEVSEFKMDPFPVTGFEDLVLSPIPSTVPANFADNSHKGRISPVALKKIRKAIDYTVYLARPKSQPYSVHGRNFTFRLNLITLTLSSPQVHSDLEIKTKLLQPMLNSFRQKYGVVNYVWRAEKQGNGNVHFHIITDKFIAWNNLRNDWNKYQQVLGYVDRYRELQLEFHQSGFQFRPEMFKNWSKEKQIEAYKQGSRNNWDNPNSTDVHSLKNVTNIKNYFIKYLTKDTQSAFDRAKENTQYSNLDGRLWGCSSRLSNLKGARADLDLELSTELLRLSEDKLSRTIKSDFFSVSFISVDSLRKQGYLLLAQLFESYICTEFPEYRPPGLFN